MEDQRFRKLLQDHFDGFETSPPEEVWENVAQAIRPRRKTGPFIWAALATAASVALFLIFWLNQPEEKRSHTPAFAEQPAAAPKTPDRPARPGTSADHPPLVIKGDDITPGRPKRTTSAVPVSHKDSSTPTPPAASNKPENLAPSLIKQPLYGLTRPEKVPVMASNDLKTTTPAKVIKGPSPAQVAPPDKLPPETSHAKTAINLNELDPRGAVVLASQELNKLLDRPVTVSRQDLGSAELVTYAVDLKFLKVTRKTTKTTKVN